MRGNKKIRKSANSLLQMSLENGEVSGERVSAVLKALQAHPPRQYKAILRDFLFLIRRELARGQAVVEHAGPLPAEILESVETAFSASYGRTITAVARENPTLIAGLRVRIGSDVYDASIANHLHELARSAN